MNTRILSYLIIFTSGFWFDRWSKGLALQVLSIKDFYVNAWLNFSLQWNRGVSFSWFATNSTAGYVVLTLGIIVVIVLFCFYAWGQYLTNKSLYGEALVIAGAISNLVDRVYYGAVIDFIDVHLGSWHFATFNGADMCICAGITWLILMQIKEVYDAHCEKNY